MKAILLFILCLFAMPLLASPSDVLIMAAKQGDIAKATKALEDGADINARVQDKASINYAALRGDLAMVSFLIQKGSAIASHHNIFSDAAQGGNTEVMKLLLNSEKDPTLIDVDAKSVALTIAADKGNLTMVQLLVDIGANVNGTSYTDETPLSNAVKNKHAAIVKYLVEKKVDLADDTFDGKPVICMAIENEDIEIVKLLIAAGVPLNPKYSQPLWVAAEKNNIEIGNLLIANGADPNILSSNNKPLLMHAMMFSNRQFVKLLLDHGVKPELTHVSGDDLTYLHAAAIGGYTETVKAALDSGLSIELPGPEETTPLMCACTHDNVETVRFLLSRKARVNAKTSTGFTPLLVAAREGSAQVVKLLLASGADVNQPGTLGWTPLMAASRYGHSEIVKVLIANKANVNASGTLFVTALWLARESGHEEVVRILKKAGAR